jgi:hypothetical protein
LFVPLEIPVILVPNVRCNIIGSVVQIFPIYLPEMFAGLTSYYVQVNLIDLIGSSIHFSLRIFLLYNNSEYLLANHGL